MAYNRRTFTLDAQSERLLRADAQAEGVNESELVRRRIHLGSLLIEACRRVPGPRTDRFARIAVLPEDAPQPRGSEVMRIWVGDPGQDNRSRSPGAPRKARPRAERETDYRVHHVPTRVRLTEDGDVELDPTGAPVIARDERAACGAASDACDFATSDPTAVTCPACLETPG